MEILKNVKKVGIYCLVTIILCGLSSVLSIYFSGKRHSARASELKQQLELSTRQHNELIDSARFGTREMGREIERARNNNQQIIIGLEKARADNRGDIEKLRRAINDSGRIEQILKEILSEN